MDASREILERTEGRHLFGLDPGGYEAGRPDYPSFVYETLAETCGLGPGTRVLEIGPGTGIVTRHLLAAGAGVVAIEPDPSLASFLRKTMVGEDLTIVEATLEEAEIDRAAFDLAVAATSFHWVDQRVGLEKLGRLIRPGGWIALWWTLFRDPNPVDPPFNWTTTTGGAISHDGPGWSRLPARSCGGPASSRPLRRGRCTPPWPPSSVVRAASNGTSSRRSRGWYARTSAAPWSATL